MSQLPENIQTYLTQQTRVNWRQEAETAIIEANKNGGVLNLSAGTIASGVMPIINILAAFMILTTGVSVILMYIAFIISVLIAFHFAVAYSFEHKFTIIKNKYPFKHAKITRQQPKLTIKAEIHNSGDVIAEIYKDNKFLNSYFIGNNNQETITRQYLELQAICKTINQENIEHQKQSLQKLGFTDKGKISKSGLEHFQNLLHQEHTSLPEDLKVAAQVISNKKLIKEINSLK